MILRPSKAPLKAVRAPNMDLSATLEQAPIKELREDQQRQWREQNRESIATHNAHVEMHSMFSDGRRRF